MLALSLCANLFSGLGCLLLGQISATGVTTVAILQILLSIRHFRKGTAASWGENCTFLSLYSWRLASVYRQRNARFVRLAGSPSDYRGAPSDVFRDPEGRTENAHLQSFQRNRISDIPRNSKEYTILCTTHQHHLDYQCPDPLPEEPLSPTKEERPSRTSGMIVRMSCRI